MFIDSSIPSEFSNIAEIGDNYVVLTGEDILSSDREYEVYIQFFKPSSLVLHTYDYVPTKRRYFFG